MNTLHFCVCSGTSGVVNSLGPHGLSPTRLLCPGDSPGKNTRVGCHALLQGIFLTQGSNPHSLCLLHCRQSLYPLSHPERSGGLLVIFHLHLTLWISLLKAGWREVLNPESVLFAPYTQLILACGEAKADPRTTICWALILCLSLTLSLGQTSPF